MDTRSSRGSWVLSYHHFFVGFNKFTVKILGENQNLTQTSDVFIEFKKSNLSLGPIIANLERTNSTRNLHLEDISVKQESGI